MSTKTASKLALGALASASTASGAIVVFDTNDLSFNADAYGTNAFIDSINISTGAFGTTSNAFNATQPLIQMYAGTFYNTFAIGGYGIDVTPFLNLGDVVSVSTAGFNTWLPQALNTVGLGVHYTGLRLTENSQAYYGWLEFTRLSETEFQINQFAFNNVAGESILAGQAPAVPEASTLGFAGGLFGLVALAHARRRKAKQAAASDKFLSLAAGVKLN